MTVSELMQMPNSEYVGWQALYTIEAAERESEQAR
jgi:hypothetical protein